MQRGFVVFVLAIAATFPAAAQVLYGSLTGNVHDAAGALVPGASVKLRNLGTAQEFTEQTNGAGSYTLSNLSPGSYDLTIRDNRVRPLPQRHLPLTLHAIRP